jgi:hypothetical protein
MITDLAFKPVAGEFDLPAIHSYLDASAQAVRDPQNPARFLLGSTAKQLRDAVAARRGANSVPYTVDVLHPTPSIIALTMRSADPEPARAFVEWLRGRQQIQILDQEFNDYTARCQDNLDLLFGPAAG